MKKKQSSIDFILNTFNLLSDSDFKKWMLNNYDVIKAMHKEEVTDAYIECWMNDGGNGFHKVKEAEQYYTKTFGGQDNE